MKMLKVARSRGFTLIELAVALVVVALVLGSILVPLNTQVEQRKISDAQKTLDQINEAIIGFALSRSPPRMPCPDTSGDGQEDACSSAFANAATGGNVPWATLGVPAIDPWGQRYRYRVNNAYGTQISLPMPAITSGSAGDLRACVDSACTTLLANQVPAVVYSLGPNGAQAAASPDEIENTNNDRTFVSRTLSAAAGAEFDDVVTWISGPILLNRMVTAGKLP